MTAPIRLASLIVIAAPILAFSCVEAVVEQPTYEVGEPGVLIIRNPSRLPMAIGGCNPASYQERLPGRWIPDGFIRPACVFSTDLDGNHELVNYELIPPRGSIKIDFPTDWLRSRPGVMRVLQRVSVACEFPRDSDESVICHGVEEITTDPVVIFEPGSTDTVGRS